MKRWPNVTAKYIDFLFNREETAVCSLCMELGSACWYHASLIRGPVDDTELQLPPSDESKVGDDV